MNEMIKSARMVVARYLGHDAEDDGLPWMEHLEETQEAIPGLSGMVRALSSAVPNNPEEETLKDQNTTGDVGKSLQEDIIDPRSMAREQDAPAARSDVEDLESGSIPITHFKDPEMYGEGSSLKYWWDSRERDENNTGTAFGTQLTGLPLEASDISVPMVFVAAGKVGSELGQASFTKEAKSLQSVISDGSSNHKYQAIVDRAKELTPTLVSSPEDLSRGVLHFSMRSRRDKEDAEKPERHVVMQFLKKPGGVVSSNPVAENDCLIGCTCPAFLYWGPQYYAISGGYIFKDMKREVIGVPGGAQEGTEVPPGVYTPKDDREKGQHYPVARGVNGTFCKHIYASYLAAKDLAFKIKTSEMLEHEVSAKDLAISEEDLEMEFKGISDYDQFTSFVYRGEIEEDLRKFVDQLHKDQGSNIQFLDSFLDKWNSWMGSQKAPEIDRMLKVMDFWKNAPAVVLYALLKSVPIVRKHKLEIPKPVLRKAFRILQGWK